MMTEFYSNGKLLLSGEYAVLDGAKAWAIPTKYGQYLRVLKNESSQLSWKSIDEKGAVWFESVYDKKDLDIVSSSSKDIAITLRNILLEAQRQNSDFLKDSNGYEIETKLTFHKDWGLGSSSTLINNIAQWANVNAYKLLWNSFSGSGYDIACAQYNYPITYQLEGTRPKVEKVEFNPSFIDNLYFIYLNKKQDSRKGIAQYRAKKFNTAKLVQELSEITTKMVDCKTLTLFETLLTEHETLLSTVLEIPTVKETLFPDYDGAIKSLGAWGGDFVMATGGHKTLSYFKEMGYDTLFSYQEMIA